MFLKQGIANVLFDVVCVPCEVVTLHFNFRQSWSRLRAIQLFVEQVMLKHPDVASLKLMARRLCGVSTHVLARVFICAFMVMTIC